MDKNEVGDIVATIMLSASKLEEKHSHLHVVITGILPKGRQKSSLRIRIRQTNALLRYQCRKLPYLSFLEQSSEWTTDSGVLNKNAFFRDHLHLIKGGNDILVRQLTSVIGPFISKCPRTMAQCVCVDQPPLLPDVCSYRPPDIPSPLPTINISTCFASPSSASFLP